LQQVGLPRVRAGFAAATGLRPSAERARFPAPAAPNVDIGESAIGFGQEPRRPAQVDDADGKRNILGHRGIERDRSVGLVASKPLRMPAPPAVDDLELDLASSRLPEFAMGYLNSCAFRSYQRRHRRPVTNAT
jgi:hypothetical protein